MKTKTVITLDGSHTIYLSGIDEHYHSSNGAIDESGHVFVEAGLLYCRKESISIFEVGFGTGLNALLTALTCRESKRSVCYTTIEKYPLDPSVTDALNYPQLLGGDAAGLFAAIHGAPWNELCELSAHFSIHKIKADLIGYNPSGYADIVYYDAFAPSKQPDMWEPAVIGKVTALLADGGIFVTYSARGELRRTLRKLDFEVFRLPGAKGKREMIRAIKQRDY